MVFTTQVKYAFIFIEPTCTDNNSVNIHTEILLTHHNCYNT